MTRKIILLAVVSLLFGAVGGYLIGYLAYQPVIRDYEAQVASLSAQVATLEQTSSKLRQTVSTQQAQISNQESKISAQEAQIAAQEVQITEQEAQISSLTLEKDNLRSELDRAEEKLKDYKKRLFDAKQELSSVKDRLNDILSITVTQHYQWVYGWDRWDWVLPIPLSAYVEYKEKPRPFSPSYWVDMATDPGDDYYIDQMVQQINKAALEKRFTEIKKLNFVAAFVQSLPYTVDAETTPYDEYPRYPIETLFDRGGDCEDTSILVAALLHRLGYDVALLLLEDAQHMAVGVVIPDTYGYYYDYGGKHYYYLETTGGGWEIGQIPPDITDTSARVYPLKA